MFSKTIIIKKYRNSLIVRLLAITIISFVSAGCSKKEQTVKQIEIKPVAAGLVQIMDIPVYFSVTGTIVPVHDVIISTEVSGKILEKLVDEGDTVVKGTVIARIDPRDFKSRVEQAQAVLKQALALQSQAQRDVESNKPLLEKKIIAPDQFANLLNRQEEAEGRVEQARAALDIARKALENTNIVSPLEQGVVVDIESEKGEYTVAGSPIARVVDLSRVYVEVQVPEGRIPSVKKGREVKFRVSAYDQDFTGTVHSIVPFADRASRTFKVKIICPNPDLKLKAGMFAVAEMKAETRRNALTVPVTAVKTVGAKSWIYEVMAPKKFNAQNTENQIELNQNSKDDNIFIAVERPVVLGVSHQERVEIVSGAEQDMVVVIKGADTISSGDILGVENISQLVENPADDNGIKLGQDSSFIESTEPGRTL